MREIIQDSGLLSKWRYNQGMPIDFGHTADPAAVGMDAGKLADLRALYERQHTEGRVPAGQFVLLRHGQVLLDIAIGSCRSGPVTHDTPFFSFSATKAITAACIHKLIGEGAIEMDAPVAQYWPQFGQKGKESATIRHVLTHHAGIPDTGIRKQMFLAPVWGLVTRQVASLKAEYPPGEKFSYHVINYGWILGEVIRRVTGQHIEDYFREEFAEPLGMMRSWLCIPRREIGKSPEIISDEEDQQEARGIFNMNMVRRAVNPAASLSSNARGLAVFYQMLLNGGEYDGRRYIDAAAIERGTSLAYEGVDHYLGREVRYAYGFYLGGLEPPPGDVGPAMGHGSSLRTFGHFGHRSCMAWADKDAKLVTVYLTNRLLGQSGTRERWTEISHAIWDAVAE